MTYGETTYMRDRAEEKLSCREPDYRSGQSNRGGFRRPAGGRRRSSKALLALERIDVEIVDLPVALVVLRAEHEAQQAGLHL